MGCIPSKALLHSTEVFHELKEHASAHGIICKEIEHDLSALMKKKDGVVDQLGKGVRALVSQKRSDLSGRDGTYSWNGEIEMNGKSSGKYSAKEIVIATGSKPVELPFFPYDGKVVVNSDHGIAFDSVPQENGSDRCRCHWLGTWMCVVEIGCEVEIIEFLPRFARNWIPKCPRLPAGFLKNRDYLFV